MSRFTSLKSFKFLFSIALLSVVSAYSFDLTVKANVDNAQVFIGDKFNYEIQVTAPENAIVDLPSFVGNLGSFEVKEMKNEKITEGMPKGTAKFTWLATLNTFVSGDFLIAPQEVNAVVGTDTVKTHTDPVAVKVSNRTTGEEADILEVEDPLSDPRLPQWLYVLFAVLGVALLVFLGWLLHKKFAKRGEAPQLPPYEEAYRSFKERLSPRRSPRKRKIAYQGRKRLFLHIYRERQSLLHASRRGTQVLRNQPQRQFGIVVPQT